MTTQVQVDDTVRRRSFVRTSTGWQHLRTTSSPSAILTRAHTCTNTCMQSVNTRGKVPTHAPPLLAPPPAAASSLATRFCSRVCRVTVLNRMAWDRWLAMAGALPANSPGKSLGARTGEPPGYTDVVPKPAFTVATVEHRGRCRAHNLTRPHNGGSAAWTDNSELELLNVSVHWHDK